MYFLSPTVSWVSYIEAQVPKSKKQRRVDQLRTVYAQNGHSAFPPTSISHRLCLNSRGWRNRLHFSMEEWRSHIVEEWVEWEYCFSCFGGLNSATDGVSGDVRKQQELSPLWLEGAKGRSYDKNICYYRNNEKLWSRDKLGDWSMV